MQKTYEDILAQTYWRSRRKGLVDELPASEASFPNNRRLIRRLLKHSLNDWERRFLTDINGRTWRRITHLQWAKLRQIAAKYEEIDGG